jgi:hypothetical protein
MVYAVNKTKIGNMKEKSYILYIPTFYKNACDER